MTDIVERLRARAARMDHMGDGLHYYGKLDAAFDREAADEIERLRSNHAVIVARRDVRNDALEEAATLAEEITGTWPPVAKQIRALKGGA
jgi:hypothetical protein